MTKAELEQYRSIEREIDEVRDRLNKAVAHDIVTGSDCEYPYLQRRVRIGGVGRSEADASDMVLLRGLEDEKKKLEDFVDNISDSVTRRIFRYRYIDGKTRPSWQWIAFKIGHYDEQYPRKKHNKFLKQYGKF